MSRSTARSEALYAEACGRLPAGVNSPVRAFRKVGGTPIYVARGEGARITDEDGNTYTDFCNAWGPLILGHAHPAVVEAVTRAARDGLAFGTTHRLEPRIAELVLSAFAPFDRVRFVVSGTEAVATAVRVARGATQRPLILKFRGCYHGSLDSLLVKAGSGLVTEGIADSAGVPAHVAEDTVVVPLGDDEALEAAFQRYGDQLAAAIVEPMPANNGLLLQSEAWLGRLRDACTRSGTKLIFDEVISGFRLGYHGYGRICGVQPDLVTLGKIVGGGLPVAAVVGPRESMDLLAPLGSVYQAGTMAGNPVALAAGAATLEILRSEPIYDRLEALGRRLDASGAPVIRRGSVVWPYYGTNRPVEADDIEPDAVARYHRAHRGWLDAGLYLPPSGYEVSFLSAAHTDADVDRLAAALRAA